jgi:hypothetical protein
VRHSLEALARREASAFWPTPTATDAKASGSAGYSTASGRHAGVTLTDAAVRKWATPNARDEKGPSTRAERHAGACLPGQVGNGGKLNPAWVESLMGFPPGWTDVSLPDGPRGAAKRSTTGRRRVRSKSASQADGSG